MSLKKKISLSCRNYVVIYVLYGMIWFVVMPSFRHDENEEKYFLLVFTIDRHFYIGMEQGGFFRYNTHRHIHKQRFFQHILFLAGKRFRNK